MGILRRKMNYLSTILILTISAGVLSEECIRGPTYKYSGTHSTTSSGRSCQRWDSTSGPHTVSTVPQDGGKHNYCRNPDKDINGTWCYTTDPSVKWEYCLIPKCDDKVIAVWTSYDRFQHKAFFDIAKADPELRDQNIDSGKIHRKVFENAQFRGLEVSKNGRSIFFTDIRNNYFGILDTETLKVQRYLKGEVEHIYAISQDWTTGRIYMTNTNTKTVISTDEKCKSYSVVYDAAPYEPRAIDVLPKNKGIVFSTYVKLNTKIRGAEIIITDKRGRNPKVILKSPDVTDVSGIVSDYKRIYWTDNLGYAAKVMSSFYDGSNKVEHYFKKFASFQSIALYSQYIYITDSQARYNYFDHIRYHIDIIDKDPEVKQKYYFIKPDQPHGIAILRKHERNLVTSQLRRETTKRKKNGLRR